MLDDVVRKLKSRSDRPRRRARVDVPSVRRAYARWAPVYDKVFGTGFRAGRNAAVAYLNELPAGRILECGVGTGISLSAYRRDHRITGMDVSPEMLAIARERVARDGLTNVDALDEADAAKLPYADESFDASVAMFVITVVPDVVTVMNELIRVTKPGGKVVFVSHFSDQRGWRKSFGEALAPLSASLGWHTDFTIDRIMGYPKLRHIETRRIGPLGFFSLVIFERT